MQESRPIEASTSPPVQARIRALMRWALRQMEGDPQMALVAAALGPVVEVFVEERTGAIDPGTWDRVCAATLATIAAAMVGDDERYILIAPGISEPAAWVRVLAPAPDDLDNRDVIRVGFDGRILGPALLHRPDGVGEVDAGPPALQGDG